MAESAEFIQPFDAALVREVVGCRTISARASSYGYDMRLPCDGSCYYLMPPHSYVHGVTVETFKTPRNVTGIATGKSTYSRFFKQVSTTVCG